LELREHRFLDWEPIRPAGIGLELQLMREQIGSLRLSKESKVLSEKVTSIWSQRPPFTGVA